MPGLINIQKIIDQNSTVDPFNQFDSHILRIGKKQKRSKKESRLLVEMIKVKVKILKHDKYHCL